MSSSSSSYDYLCRLLFDELFSLLTTLTRKNCPKLRLKIAKVRKMRTMLSTCDDNDDNKYDDDNDDDHSDTDDSDHSDLHNNKFKHE